MDKDLRDLSVDKVVLFLKMFNEIGDFAAAMPFSTIHTYLVKHRQYRELINTINNLYCGENQYSISVMSELKKVVSRSQSQQVKALLPHVENLEKAFAELYRVYSENKLYAYQLTPHPDPELDARRAVDLQLGEGNA